MKFDLSFWNYLYIDDYYSDMENAVKEWKELGITIAFSFRYSPEKGGKEKMLRLLELCKMIDIRLIINDDRVFYTALKEKGEQAYLEGVKQALTDFGSDFCYGFYLGDEPDQSMFPIFEKAHRIFSSVTDKVGFINYSWNEGIDKVYGGRAEYKKYLDDFYKRIGAKVISNDRYSAFNFCDYEPGFMEKGKEYYFADIKLFSSLAKQNGAKYFISQLSCGHLNFRTPDVDAIRWQLSTAIACGADCVQWFFLYQHRFQEDYYVYPIDIYGDKSQIYYAIKRETAFFKQKVLKPLEDYSYHKTFFITKSYGGFELLSENSDTEWYVYADHGKNGIYAEFICGGKKKYLVVNADQFVPEVFFMKNKANKALDHYVWLAPGGTHVF